MSINPNPDRRARYAAVIDEGFRTFDADTTEDAYLITHLTDAVVAAVDAEQAELRAVVARLTQMTDYWEQQLPEVIRTPAVVSAIRAVLEPAAVSVVPPATNQTARDRIAEVLWPLTDWDGDQLNAERAADAVLAVLPAPVDRAAVLREAADWFDSGGRSVSQLFGHQAAAELRRLAAEAPHTETPDDADPPCTCAAAGDCFAPAGHYADCPSATPPAVVAQPGKEA